MAAFTTNHPDSRFTIRPSKEGSGRVDIYYGGTTIACEVLPSEVQARINRFADRMSRGPSALDQSPTGAPIAGQGQTVRRTLFPVEGSDGLLPRNQSSAGIELMSQNSCIPSMPRVGTSLRGHVRLSARSLVGDGHG